MIQEVAFDPETGAPLSESKEWTTWYHVGVRTVERDGVALRDDRREGALTNGELKSSADGLKGYFQRVHRSVRDRPDGRLDSAAALGIDRLRRASNEDVPDHHSVGQSALDVEVWFALAERLAQKGYWVAWMFDHAIPRCPLCRSECKIREAVYEPDLVCASSPNRHGRVNDRIRERIRDLYVAAFDDWPAEPIFFNAD